MKANKSDYDRRTGKKLARSHSTDLTPDFCEVNMDEDKQEKSS